MAKRDTPASEIRDRAARTMETSKKLRAESQEIIRAVKKAQKMAQRVLGVVKRVKSPLGSSMQDQK